MADENEQLGKIVARELLPVMRGELVYWLKRLNTQKKAGFGHLVISNTRERANTIQSLIEKLEKKYE